jgi:peptidoglycan/LPS O-acetylase OafA/YrhL
LPARVKGSSTYSIAFPAVASLASVLIVIGLAWPTVSSSQVFRIALLVWFGRISCSLCLWHLPIASVLSAKRLKTSAISATAVECIRPVACLLVATLSYYLLEKRFLRLKHRVNKIEPALP